MLSVEMRDELAADLAQAERSRVPIAPLTAAYPDIDVVDAYEIQLINIRQRVAEGARVMGHKVGLSSEAMQKMMGVDEPDYGHLLDEMEVFEDTPVKAGRYLYPRVEVEVGFILADDLPGAGCTEDDVLAATDGVRPVDRVDRHQDHRLEDRVVRHHRRQRLVGGLRAGQGAGVAEGHRRQADRRGAHPQRRGGRRGPQRRGAGQPGHRGGVVGPQGGKLWGTVERVTSCCPDRAPGRSTPAPATISSPTSRDWVRSGCRSNKESGA